MVSRLEGVHGWCLPFLAGFAEFLFAGDRSGSVLSQIRVGRREGRPKVTTGALPRARSTQLPGDPPSEGSNCSPELDARETIFTTMWRELRSGCLSTAYAMIVPKCVGVEILKRPMSYVSVALRSPETML